MGKFEKFKETAFGSKFCKVHSIDTEQDMEVMSSDINSMCNESEVEMEGVLTEYFSALGGSVEDFEMVLNW